MAKFWSDRITEIMKLKVIIWDGSQARIKDKALTCMKPVFSTGHIRRETQHMDIHISNMQKTSFHFSQWN